MKSNYNNESVIIHRLVLEINLVFHEDVEYREVNAQVESIKEMIIQQLEYSIKEQILPSISKSKKILINKIEIEANGNLNDSFAKTLAATVALKLNTLNKSIQNAINRQNTSNIYTIGNISINNINPTQESSLTPNWEQTIDSEFWEEQTKGGNAETAFDKKNADLKRAFEQSSMAPEKSDISNKKGSLESSHLADTHKRYLELLESELIAIMAQGDEDADIDTLVPSSALIKEELLFFLLHGRNRWQTLRAAFNFENQPFLRVVHILLVSNARYFLPILANNINAHNRFVGLVPRHTIKAYFETLLLPLVADLDISPLFIAEQLTEQKKLAEQALVLRIIKESNFEANTSSEFRLEVLLKLIKLVLGDSPQAKQILMTDASNPYVKIVQEILKKHPIAKKAMVGIWPVKKASKGKVKLTESTTYNNDRPVTLIQVISAFDGVLTTKTEEGITFMKPNDAGEIAPHATIPSKPSTNMDTGTIGDLLSADIIDEASPNGTLVHYAGLVLIAPFLPAVFENMGIWQKGSFVSTQKQERAVRLLNFIATGNGKPEHEDVLFICKLMCGLPVDSFIDLRRIVISKMEREEIEALFVAIKKYWPVLKNTSIANIQASFLQREGILYQRDSNYLLKIDRTTIDILLDQMQWGFRMVKLPWCDYMLETEW